MPDTSLRSLVDDLASPDPAVRDDGAYATLTRLVRDGDLPVDDRSWLGDAMVQRLRHERAEARSFAPLVLASLVAVGDLDEAWIPAVTRLVLATSRTCAGTIRSWGGSTPSRTAPTSSARAGPPASGTRPPCSMPSPGGWSSPPASCGATRRRTGSRVPWPWCSRVTTSTSRRPSGGSTTSARLFASGSPGPVPAEASNTMRTLRSLHVALGEQPLRRGEPVTVQHGELVRTQVAAVLHEVTPWSWRPPRRKVSTRQEGSARHTRGAGRPRWGAASEAADGIHKQGRWKRPPTLSPRAASGVPRRRGAGPRPRGARGRARSAEAERALPMKLVLQVQRQIT